MQTLLSALLLVAADAPALEVHPDQVLLTGSRQRVQLVVTTPGHDHTRSASITSADPKVAEVIAGVVWPRGNGKTSLTIRVGSLSRVIPVEVRGQERPEPVSLTREVLPIFTKQGCNGGACHGSPTGKGGFRLSLRGYNVSLDQRTLRREVFARRITPLDPDASLLLRKPLQRIPHEGGLRLVSGGIAHGVLRTWIAEGGQADIEAPVSTGIEVYPQSQTLLWPAYQQQLAVVAHFADGSHHDVTHLTTFSSSDEVVAKVSASGLVQGQERGEVAILARYGDHTVVSSFTQLRAVPGFVWSDPPEQGLIDRLVFARLKRLQIPPSPLCTDGELIRRVYLDVLGILPTPGEVRAFLADPDPDKRTQLIDHVLNRPEYAEYWAHRWGDLLQVKAGKLSAQGAERMHAWLLEAGRSNMPFDRFARSLLTATGSTFTNPPASYFRTSADAPSRAENTAQLFLGARIQCAKCHNHPGDTWTQDAYFGIAAFFAQVDQKPAAAGEMIVSLGKAEQILQPLSGTIATPRLPGHGPVKVADVADHRTLFVDWLTRPDNPTFAKVAVNRVWGHLLGRGLVDPIDDFRVANPPAHPDLLDQLAKDFIRDGYNLKKLTRAILQSRVYQLSSATLPLNENDDRYFSHAHARLIPAEVLADAIDQVTGTPTVYPGRPVGTRAVQLPGPVGENPFLKTFGQPARETSCLCERSSEPRLAQALTMIGGDLLQDRLRHPSSRLSRHLDSREARLALAGQPPREGMVLWLDASRGVIGTEVSQWQDQSGQEHHVSQGNATHRPLLAPGGPGGLPTVRFDGKDDYLNNITTNLLPTGSPRTLLVVGRATDSGGALLAFRRQSSGGKPVFVAQQGAYHGSYYVYTDGINGTGNSTLPPTTVGTLRQSFLSVHLSAGPAKKLGVRLNGKDQPVEQPGAIGKDEGSTGFVVGNREDVALTMFPWGGDISEVLVYDHVLSEKELAQAERYLAIRYNLPTGVKVALPVKSAEQARAEDEKLIVELYLSALCREPTPEEMKSAQTYLASAESRRAGLEDLFWAVLNAREFLFRP